jgi:hypothetical protein
VRKGSSVSDRAASKRDTAPGAVGGGRGTLPKVRILHRHDHDSGRGMGGERSSSTGTWAVEFDGPLHFLKRRAPTGHTLLKRRHLELLGHALVTVPNWEWEGCKGAGGREQYLRGKLAHCVQTPGNARLQ